MTGRDLEGHVRPGDVLAGKYRVERVLGAGGMGVVVAAHHVQLDTRVAIKFLLPEMLETQEAVTRFTNEARRAVKFTSEHVARVLDVGTLESGAPYIVMEFLEGEDLSAWLKQRGPLPIDQAVDFLLQAGVAVADAHALGIVHRDLKPANMFCVRRSDGQLSIKVLDFGISKMTEATLTADSPSSGMGMTRTTTIMGSPFYMSPEQMQSPKEVGPPSDIWALGIVLYELLTARVPFEGATYADIAIKVATKPPPHVRQLRPDVPEALEAAIEKCLERDPRRRYRHVGQLASAIAPFAPTRARSSVDRISGILQAAGLLDASFDASTAPLHETAFAPVTPETAFAPETISPVGGTAPGVPRKSKAAIGAIVGLAAALLVGIAVKVVWPAPRVDERSEESHATASLGGAGTSQPSPTSPHSPTPDRVDLVPALDPAAANPGAGSLGVDAGEAPRLAVTREHLHPGVAHPRPLEVAPPSVRVAAPPALLQRAATQPLPLQATPNDDQDPLAKLRPK